MGFSPRHIGLPALAALPALAMLVLAPAIASAQSPGAPAAAAPATGTAAPQGAEPAPAPAPSPAPAGSSSAAPPADARNTGDIGGVTFKDKPRHHTVARAVRHSGPIATFPGFEQLADGGSRLFVQLSQAVPVEERRAQGSITYVLKGAHLRVHNDANALVTVHFNTPVYRARLTPHGGDLLFVLELRSAASPTFKVTENPDKTSTLQIDFAKGDFLTGDGSERLPAETKPSAATPAPANQAHKRARGTKAARPAGESGPNP